MIRTITTRVWTCDRCGKDMPGASGSYEIAQVRVEWQGRDAMGNGGGAIASYDLCATCAPLLRSFIRPENNDAQ